MMQEEVGVGELPKETADGEVQVEAGKSYGGQPARHIEGEKGKTRSLRCRRSLACRTLFR